jgi:hypothetical protein
MSSSEVVGDAREARVDVGAAEVLGRDHLARRAFTSGGPARKMVPCSRTMIASSHMAGT